MTISARVKVRSSTWPGDEPSTRHGYIAPDGHSPDPPGALIRWEYSEATECLEPVYSYIPPHPDSLLVWWPGNRWTWEDSGSVEPVPDDRPGSEHRRNDHPAEGLL
ncbi:hypothetical protein ACIHDR_48435 [Nocardia sp. NPDC052278]|uniref:hypothetical protein n=1 Tax=unclassified Nocardia TaxID=2637762 RepID=UPI00369C57A5